MGRRRRVRRGSASPGAGRFLLGEGMEGERGPFAESEIGDRGRTPRGGFQTRGGGQLDPAAPTR